MADIISVMNIFEFTSYKKYFQARLKAMPKKGHGQLLKIAKFLSVHTTFLTHVFKGSSNLSAEQALKLTKYLELDTLETDYFMNLVHFERAGDTDCQAYYQQQLDQLQKKSFNLKTRVKAQKVLDEKDQALFYSEWTYSAVNLLTAIDGFQDAYSIAEQVNLPVVEVKRILDFLVQTGLCLLEKDQYRIGDAQTFLGKDSPMLRRHLLNWRTKAMEQAHKNEAEDLMFSNPIVLSEKDFQTIHRLILNLIKEFQAVAAPSPSELLCCLNIDWVKIK